MNGKDKTPAPHNAPPAQGARAGSSVASPAGGGAVDSFLQDARRIAPVASGRTGRLVFALDATMSRQPTWDLAAGLQAQMFETAASLGGLSVQLVYFRGFNECRASTWVADARALTGLMGRITCQGGHTQIARVLKHIRDEAKTGPVRAFVLVGDASEESIDDLCALAGELGLRGIRGFLFQEGSDPAASVAFAEMARLTGGIHARFDASAPGKLAQLLRVAAAYAGGGLEGLRKLAGSEGGEARRLLTAMERKP